MQVTLRARLGMIIKFNKESWKICYAVKSSLSCDIFLLSLPLCVIGGNIVRRD